MKNARTKYQAPVADWPGVTNAPARLTNAPPYWNGTNWLAGATLAAGSNAVDIVSVLGANTAQTDLTLFMPPDKPQAFLYDLNGNMTNDGYRVYTWDEENRLTAIETAPAATAAGLPAQRSEYLYDAQWRRIFKTDYAAWDESAFVATNTTRFVWDGWNLLAEISGSTTNHYVWGLDLSGSLQGAGGIGGLLCVLQSGTGSLPVDSPLPLGEGGAGVPPATYFPSYDGNGNITDYLDTNGAIVAHREYDPFGRTVATTGDLQAEFTYWFSTKPEEPQWGLYYYGLRFYLPGLGRFVNRDPMWDRLDSMFADTLDPNCYCFVENKPVDEVEFLGLYTWEELPTVDVSVATLLRAGGIGGTTHQLSIEQPLSIKFKNCCCYVEQPESYKQTVRMYLPSVRSRARGAWVTGSSRRGVSRHEKKHVRIWKHYGMIWPKFENWQKRQSASGATEADCRAKLLAHIQVCGAQASGFFNAETSAAHAALDAAEGWRIVGGWIPAMWLPRGRGWPWHTHASVFETTGNWHVRLNPVKLDCSDMKCDK